MHYPELANDRLPHAQLGGDVEAWDCCWYELHPLPVAELLVPIAKTYFYATFAERLCISLSVIMGIVA